MMLLDLRDREMFSFMFLHMGRLEIIPVRRGGRLIHADKEEVCVKGVSSIYNFNFSHFFKWILQIVTKIGCSVKRKSPLILPVIANLQFKHLILEAKFVYAFIMQTKIFTFFQIVS